MSNEDHGLRIFIYYIMTFFYQEVFIYEDCASTYRRPDHKEIELLVVSIQGWALVSSQPPRHGGRRSLATAADCELPTDLVIGQAFADGGRQHDYMHRNGKRGFYAFPLTACRVTRHRILHEEKKPHQLQIIQPRTSQPQTTTLGFYSE